MRTITSNLLYYMHHGANCSLQLVSDPRSKLVQSHLHDYIHAANPPNLHQGETRWEDGHCCTALPGGNRRGNTEPRHPAINTMRLTTKVFTYPTKYRQKLTRVEKVDGNHTLL